MRPNKMRKKWQTLQKYCSDKATWSKAVTEADKLLDRALKKRRMKGKSLGERLASAQDLMSDNDAIWYAHNLAKKLRENVETKLKKTEVKKSLLAFGQALKDLGALRNGKH
ncbi:MAG TPA: hypothetical protein VJJ78_00925 [Candidatus Saccharimonadales bacterium]|nr:hypothetical protein [Candidatus Saccharimonadales bacterium]